MMGGPVEQGRRHLRVGEHGRPLAEREVRRHHDRHALVEIADQVEQELAPAHGERKVAQLVENDEVQPTESPRHPSLAIRLGFRHQPVDQIDDIEEPAAATVPDPAAGQADREMRLAGPDDKNRVVLPVERVPEAKLRIFSCPAPVDIKFPCVR